ncbi:AraC family transcriptional regulator ligand-binding domain-containing protein [Corallococcus sp. bb12-1]|uniref:AraC family transcriptional regulator n=1 Tax=Corallococcus sp. bb12-1 TaxID=2996784 RepID=UPI00226F0507|nr:AraC family transcriptional regulator [Corallococcus sp. bb12-1]MCY1043219.1 AraC family transcriptional regulator ligand-binding domain-containing protein [Corallococcus sp. bb12-1]
MPPSPRTLVQLPRSLCVSLREAGVDVDALARRMGVASAAERFTLEQSDALLDQALLAVKDPSFVLTATARLRPELFGVVGLAAMAAPDLGSSLSRLERYKRLFSSDTLELVRGRDGVRVRLHLGRPESASAPFRAELEFTFLVAFSRRMTGTQVVPLRVDRRGPPVAHRGRSEAFLGIAVNYRQPEDVLVLSALDMARPLVSSSPDVAALLGPRVEELLKECGTDDVVGQVRAVLRRMLTGEEPSLDAVARALGSSSRGLQRRLSEARTSFVTLLREVRCEVACERLAGTDIDISELSFLLGFSEPSAFHRAFRRWRGMTPAEFRRASRAPIQDRGTGTA